MGFDSIEADLYLKDGELYVAHDWKNIRPERTLTKLYIEPLLVCIKKNGSFPYPNKKSLHLLLDLKQNGKAILEVLFLQLKPYRKALRHVQITISGDMPTPSEFQNYHQMFSFDGRKNLIYDRKAYKRVALVSASFLDFGKYWAGQEPLSNEIFQKINTFVEETHAKGKKVRIWGTPNTTPCFETLRKLKVDVIGTDDLALLAKFKTSSKQELK